MWSMPSAGDAFTQTRTILWKNWPKWDLAQHVAFFPSIFAVSGVFSWNFGPGAFNTPPNSTRRPPERERKKRTQMGAGEGRAPPFWAPPFKPPTFSRFVPQPSTLRGLTIWGPTLRRLVGLKNRLAKALWPVQVPEGFIREGEGPPGDPRETSKRKGEGNLKVFWNEGRRV